jgi:hypothetical protein
VSAAAGLTIDTVSSGGIKMIEGYGDGAGDSSCDGFGIGKCDGTGLGCCGTRTHVDEQRGGSVVKGEV